jgi:hypothetical protein
MISNPVMLVYGQALTPSVLRPAYVARTHTARAEVSMNPAALLHPTAAAADVAAVEAQVDKYTKKACSAVRVETLLRRARPRVHTRAHRRHTV